MKKGPSVLVIFLTVFIDLVGFGIVVPLIALYSKTFGAHGWQIGVIVAINGRASGVEMFDSAETLRTYLPKIMRSYALDAIANATKKPHRAEEKEATRLLDSILELDTKSFPAVGLGEDLRIDSPDITGGALCLDGRVIHLAAFNTSPPSKN